MNVETTRMVEKLMTMTEDEQTEFFYQMDEDETLELTKAFYEALTELIEVGDPDYTIPSWEEVEEILNMESERGIK